MSLEKSLKESLISSVFLAILVVICCIIYWKGLNGPFIFDDFKALSVYRSAEISWQGLSEVYYSTSSGFHPISRIIPSLSFLGTAETLGHSPFSYKLHNLAIHCLLGVLVWLFFFTLTRISHLERNRALFVSCVGTAIWALHPMQVSTVLYSVQRIAQLSTLFTIICLTLFLSARVSESRKKQLFFYFCLIPFFLALGLMSKENAVLIPIFFGMLSVYVGSLNSVRDQNKIDTWFVRVFVIIPILCGLIVLLLFSDKTLNYSARDFTLYERTLNQIYFVAFYLKQFFLPKLSSMGLYFDDHIEIRSFSPLVAILLSVHLTLVSLGIYLLKRGSLLGVGILFFYAGHILESTVIPLEFAFEHRNYLPYIGVSLALPYLISLIQSNTVRLGITFLVVPTLLAMTLIRVDSWSSEVKWIQTAITYHPNSSRAQTHYIKYLNDHRLFEERDQANTQAIERFPNFGGFLINRIMFGCYASQPQQTAKQDLDQLTEIYASRKIYEQDIKQINQLVVSHRSRGCSNISIQSLDNFLTDMSKLSSTQGSPVLSAHIEATQSMLNIEQGKYELASSRLERAFKLTGSETYLLKSVVALQFSTATLEIAEQKFENIMKNHQFNLTLHGSEIDSIRENFKILRDMSRSQNIDPDNQTH